MPLERDEIGELLDRRIQQFDAEQDKQRTNHGDVPADARCGEEAKRHRDCEHNRLLAHGGFVAQAIAEPAQ
jgi:hypothetical protein